MKTIVITGSTSGLGKELVKLFALTEDCKIFAGYRNKDLINPQNNIEYFYIDMTDSNSIKNATEFIKSKTTGGIMLKTTIKVYPITLPLHEL